MKLLASFVAVAAAACGSSPSASTPQVLTFERWSVPQASSHDVLLAARGDVVVMARRISRDGGATWTALDASLGELQGVTITGQVMTVWGTASKLARWDLTTDAITRVTGGPSFVTDRTWRAAPDGSLFGFDAVENTIAIERGGTWTTHALPQPTATELRPYIKDVESNGQIYLAVSAWGVHRSTDGATWTFVAAAGNRRDVLVLADRRFAVVGDGPALVFDAAGAAAGTLPGLQLDAQEASVCEDGAIVANNRVTRDLGATWQSLLTGGDLAIQVSRTTCGGGRYWALALSDVWGYRLVRFDSLGAIGVAAGNWSATGDQAWMSGGPPIVRTADGTFIAGGLALVPGATEWLVRETPARTWASGDVVFGVQRPAFYTSFDSGSTWTAAPATGLAADEPEAFARGPDGTLHVSQFTGTSESELDTWRSVVWRSRDQGASWSIAYEGIATRVGDEISGEAHRFVGVTADGTWIATDAISRDDGATWQATEVKGDRGLAHLTRSGALVTGGADEKLWRVYADGGLGELLATYEIEVAGEPVPASQLRSVAFDDAGHAYVARGTPHVQLWRSDRPVE